MFAGCRRLNTVKDLEELGIRTLRLDVTDQDSIDEARVIVEQEAKGRGLDILYNNAGLAYTTPCTDIVIEDVHACFDVNVYGVMRMVKTFSPLLIQAKGKIIQTGSVGALMQFPFASGYAAAKAALHQYSNVLRIEMATFGVKVVTVITAAVGTNFADKRPLPDGE